MVDTLRDVSFKDLGRIGRLGNALYQICSTVGVAYRHGVEPRVNADWLHRPFFSFPAEIFTSDFSECLPLEDTPDLAHIDPQARIYAQDFSLFSDHMPLLREWLSPSAEAQSILDDQEEFLLLKTPILAVHVRRGDNAPGGDPGTPNKHLWHPMPSLEYYQSAVGWLAPGCKSVAVFGDDPEWNKINIPGDYHHVGVSRPKEQEADYLTAPILDWIDWFMISSCQSFALANSTFGMMAAHTSGSTDVSVPWPIYGPNLGYIDANLMLAPSWSKIRYPQEAEI